MDLEILVGCDLWHLSLPDDEIVAIYKDCISKKERDLIANIAIKFSSKAILMGLEVSPTGIIPPDSNGIVA